MKYYKIIMDNSFIGVVHSGQFIRENTAHKLFHADEEHGQFAEYEGILYRDYWMQPLNDCIHQYNEALVQEITEEEYITIKNAIDEDEEIIIDDDDEEEILPVPDPEQISETIQFMRDTKINQMSKVCRTTIESGFDLDLRGETHHFSLTTQDQLNLMNLSTMAQTQDLIPYHADGEETLFYSAEEIKEIIAAANQFKIYQTTYYNALKTYINALETIEEISAIEYGITIPEEYKSDVLRMLEQ